MTCHLLRICCQSLFLFFFQAEDGIRDVAVTGVQTCALPISTLLCCQTSFFVTASMSASVCSATAIALAPPLLQTGTRAFRAASMSRSEEHTSELQSRLHLVCRLLLEKKKKKKTRKLYRYMLTY